MNRSLPDKIIINDLESLLLKHFKEEPFHNLYILYRKKPISGKYGGTCSDKALSFISAARTLGYSAHLHSGYIGGREIHRLVRIIINNRTFFADVGNGWPSLKLYPSDHEINFSCFGMEYRTEIVSGRIVVFHTRNGKQFRQLEIDIEPCNEEDIKGIIAKRFNSGIIYPFKDSVRFSLVVEDQFMFLRGECLEIYTDSSFNIVKEITKEQLPKILLEQFKYAPNPLFEYLTDGKS